MSCAEIRRGIDIRLISAVETLRQLRTDGFSIDAIVEVALGKRMVPGDRPDEEHPFIVQLYREAIGEAPRRPSTGPMEPAPVSPNAPVFANFVLRWPQPIAPDHRDLVAFEWRKLTMAERAHAIDGIGDWIALCRLGGRGNPGPATLYLRDRSWKRKPAVTPANSPKKRTTA